MRRIAIAVVMSLMLVLVVASVALAQNPHFKGRSGPTTTDQGTTLNVTGTLAGLGQEGGTIELVAEGFAIVQCTNPGQGGDPAGNEPPGQQPLPLELTSGEVPIEGVTKSGNFTFNLTTLEPSQEQIEGACKENFTATLLDVEFGEFSIIVKQGGETTTLGPFTA